MMSTEEKAIMIYMGGNIIIKFIARGIEKLNVWV